SRVVCIWIMWFLPTFEDFPQGFVRLFGSVGLRLQNLPAFRLGPWRTFDDTHGVTDVVGVLLIVSPVFLGLTVGLFQNRVGKASLVVGGYCLFVCIAGHGASQNAFGHLVAPYSFAAAAAFSFRMVLTRAALRRAAFICDAFSSW